MKIGLIGDSTVALQSGWGPAFASRFNDKAEILNYAKNGATLESLSKKLDALVKLKPDYVLIQFGHNDQKRYDTNVYSSHLKSYIERIRKAGGKPIVVSSVVRRSFDENGKIVSNMVKSEKFTFKANLTAYAKAAESVAVELNVPFIDLHSISAEHHNKIGRAESMTYNFKEGDTTHFNKKGGEAIVDLILSELLKVIPELATCINAEKTEQEVFKKAEMGKWREVFDDKCIGDWKKKWFLDGEIGTVETGKEGMTLTAGPEYKNDAHNMVLWTKDSFEGDLKIEYDYTRLDDEKRCVTILYIQATGSGEGEFAKDISKWSELRKIPSMKTYFNNMNTYHISYAAFPNRGKDCTQYIRARRYMPHKSGLRGSDLEPDYYPEGLFAKGVKHHITVIKRDRDIYMRIKNPGQIYYCHMSNPDLPPVNEGRIGLRHMYTRSATYKNFKISKSEGKSAKTGKAPGYQGDVPMPTYYEVKYGKHERNVLDFWQAESEKPTPLVLVIHGGGWNAGNKERLMRFADVNAILKAGISVAATNYRLRGHAGDVVPFVKAPMHDNARALQFLRSKAKEWNIDSTRIGAAGGSAGACTSLWLAYHDDLADPNSKDPVERESTRLMCAAVNGAQTTLDPKQMKEWTPNSKYGGHAFGKKNFAEFLKDRESILPWIKEYSPYSLASKDDPAVAIFYNRPPSMGKEQKDPTHTANFGIGLQKRCKELGIECIVVYPGSKEKVANATEYLIEKLKKQN